jgi:hypothetical protein
MRVRLLVACSALVLLTACGSGTPPPRPVTTTAPPPPTTQPTTNTERAADFRVDLTVQRAGLGLLAVTDTATRPVTVRGWPTLTFYDAADDALPVPVREVAVPGAGPSIIIGPGETAFAGVRWTVGDKADPRTFVATTLAVTPPATAGAVTVHVIGTDGQEQADPEFALTGAEIGTLQPSSQGVLVF